jgi:rieske iron-sulfur protein
MAGAPISRRTAVGGCLIVSGGLWPLGAQADQTPDPDRLKLPQPGDQLIAVGGDTATPPLKSSDLQLRDLVLAWAWDPQKKVPRDGSRLNMVVLMRFDPATLGDREKRLATDGIVAYSAVCTHQQCWVTDWLKSTQILQCPCHQSQYDLRHGAKVVGGPAPRPLPALPLKTANAVLVVAGPFTDRVGGEQQQGA